MNEEMPLFKALTCPDCGYCPNPDGPDDLSGWDVMGADWGNLMCPQCATEFPCDD